VLDLKGMAIGLRNADSPNPGRLQLQKGNLSNVEEEPFQLFQLNW
jgi:hypothetical protein